MTQQVDEHESTTDNASDPRRPPSVRPTSGAQLVRLTGAGAGRRYKLGDRLSIGRGEDNTIAVEDDAKASRHHAEITRDATGFVLRDLSSRNGTIVNDVRVERRRLRYGDEIIIGDRTWFLFTMVDPREERALERQKMEAIGRLGAGVAHDFNNLLAAIVATLESVNALPPSTRLDDREVRECLGDIRVAVGRTTELTHRLLTFSRNESVELGMVDMTAVCLEVVQLLRRTLDHSISVSADIAPNLRVDGHIAEIHQAIMNLCINARDAMKGGGSSRLANPAPGDSRRPSAFSSRLTIHASLVDPEAIAGVSLLMHVPHVVVAITDTGVGMDEETQKRVFEPFFTTKGKAAFAGFGLATVFDVATTHGGRVDIRSEVGRGTTVRLALPARVSGRRKTREHAATRPSCATLPEPRVGRVLLVDDQPLIRKSWRRLLLRAGHSVTLAENGEEGLAAIATNPPPDVVLLDIDMPVLDGVATLERLRESHPNLAVVCVSGHWDRTTETRLIELGALAVVEKPLSARRLLELVDMALVGGADLSRRDD